MIIKTYIVDSFTDHRFQGNPAGVCLLNNDISSKTMQLIAKELNLSETAFIQKKLPNHFSIRYFTPTIEVDFCGHATLAASKVLLKELKLDNIDFSTINGLKLKAKNDGDYILMNFPLYTTVPVETNQKLLVAFGITTPLAIRLSKDLNMLLIEVENVEVLKAIKPNFQKALESSSSIKEVVVTAQSNDEEYDFYSRCFCPWIGINEDPVTGAAHSVLAKYWGELLDKTEMSAFQVSDRGGYLLLKIISETKLEVRSKAQIVFKGEINI